MYIHIISFAAILDRAFNLTSEKNGRDVHSKVEKQKIKGRKIRKQEKEKQVKCKNKNLLKNKKRIVGGGKKLADKKKY